MSEVAGNQIQEWAESRFTIASKGAETWAIKESHTLSARDSLNTGYGPLYAVRITSVRIKESGCQFCTIPHILQDEEGTV
jgi:hypothetical protein